jgi:acyl-CoA reductase-like NAD-dependent aldehyde dehydrogenase
MIEAGTVGINHYMPDHNSPTSMIKASGVGVNYGRESLASFQRFQSIYL